MGKTYIIEENGRNAAFFTLGMSYDKTGYKVRKSALSRVHAIKLLQFIKKLQNEKKPELDFDLQPDSILSNPIMEFKGFQYMDYGWQVKIPDIKRSLLKIKGLLEERFQNSSFQRLSNTITLSNYQTPFSINFKDGKILEINSANKYPGEMECDVQILGSFLYKLLLGDKSFEDINYIIKDAMIKQPSKALISILFPKKTSFVETYY